MRSLPMLLVAACLFSAAVAPAAAAAAQVAEVGMVVNRPEFQRAGSRTWAPAEEKKALFQNDWIRTGSRDRASILYVSGSEVKVDANTKMIIHGAATGRQRRSLLRLFLGRLWARINPPSTSTTELRAGTVTVSVRGTDLMLGIDEQGRVSLLVLAGEAVMTALGESVVVQAGQQCAAAPGRPPGQALPADASEAEWANQLGPSAPVPPALTTGKVLLGVAVGTAVVQRLVAEHHVADTVRFYTPPGAPEMGSPDPKRALLALFRPVPRDSTVGEEAFSPAGTGLSVGVGFTSADEAQRGGTAGASVYVQGRWQLGGGSSGPVVRVGSVLTSPSDAQQREALTYVGLELPAGRLGRASLELREWQPGGIAVGRWAVAVLAQGRSRFGLAHDLRHGRHACLLETYLSW